ncbi:hypothetical protein [Galbibacter sp. BG1]
MILGFSQKWPKTMPAHMAGNNTYFPEKILASLLIKSEKGKLKQGEVPGFISDYSKFIGHSNTDETLKIIDKVKPKIHTIRGDEKNRWGMETIIDFFINVRTKNMFRFAPKLPCTSTQEIKIRYETNEDDKASITIDGVLKYDSLFTTKKEEKWLEEFVTNDGFDSIEDFFAWFKNDFTGKIISWTELKY